MPVFWLEETHSVRVPLTLTGALSAPQPTPMPS